MPSAFAVFRLMTNSNLLACATGNSAGFSPLRTLPVYQAIAVQNVGSVAHQTASDRKGTPLIDRRHGMANSQGGKLINAAKNDRARADHEPAR
jgi:hypothetical protein